MGLFDVITGRRKLKQPAPDRLFAMSTAGVTLDTSMGLHSSGKAAIVFQPLATADFDAIVKDMEEIVGGVGDETGTTVEKSDDQYGYRWMILSDPDFEDLVVGVNGVSTALQGGGYGERILTAVFAFRDDQDRHVAQLVTGHSRTGTAIALPAVVADVALPLAAWPVATARTAAVSSKPGHQCLLPM